MENKKWFFIIPCLFITIYLLIVLSLHYGSITIPWRTLYSLFMGDAVDNDKILKQIVFNIRLPRAIMTLLVGAGLALTGLLLQTITRNHLADPFLFGLSSGAATGAVFVITIIGEILGPWTLPLFSFIGSLTAAMTVLVILRWQPTSQGNLILTGLTTSFVFAAMTNFLIFYGDQRSAQSLLFWSLGELGLARWNNLWLPLTGLCILILFVLKNHRKLDALLAGESTAVSLGISVKQLRYQSFIIAALSTATFVAMVGVIGFVGLMIPHIAKTMTSALHLARLVITSLLGSLFLLLSDILSRTLLAPQELPIGVITGALGAIFMLFIIRKINS